MALRCGCFQSFRNLPLRCFLFLSENAASGFYLFPYSGILGVSGVVGPSKATRPAVGTELLGVYRGGCDLTPMPLVRG